MRLGAGNRTTTSARPLEPAWPSTDDTPSIDTTALAVGSLVDVRNRFDDTWSPGFALTELGADNCKVRRVTDDAPLPVWFALEDVRVTRP
ncbi:MAG: hypothetical protein KGR17_12200 [Acidobacteria bacterium]|nr:hypothetical protein [Acidobacteriota bacterium]